MRNHSHHIRCRIYKVSSSPRFHRTVGIMTQRIHEIQVAGIIAMIIMFQSFSVASMIGTDTLIYPLSRVSTLECRTQLRDEMKESCKIDLPIIKWANYSAYRDQKLYTDIYTTLWWWTYNDGWDVAKWWHPWIDIATAKWTPLLAIADGEVVFAWWQNLYGNVVKVKHIYRWEIIYSVYAHVSEMHVKKWDKVTQWQVIAEVWNTGLVFGQLWGFHLNFEIHKADKKWNPTRAFSGCPDSRKDRVRLVNEWACRIQMWSNSYDPIALIQERPTVLQSAVLWWTETKQPIPSPPAVPSIIEKPIETVSQPVNSIVSSSLVRSNIMSVESSVRMVVQALSLPVRINAWSQNTIQLLFLWDDDNPYSWIFKKSIQLISTDTNIVTSSLKSIQRISWWSVWIVLTWVKKGSSSIVLMRDGKRLGVVDVVVE